MREEREFRMRILEMGMEKEHFHQEIELIYILEGSVTLILTGDTWQMKKNDILLINTNRRHSWYSEGQNLVCRIYIDYGMLTKMTGRYFLNFWCNSMVNWDEDYDKLKFILNSLIREYQSCGDRDSFLLYSMKYSLLECLTREFVIQGEILERDTGDDRVERMVEYISSHYRDSVSLSEIAEKLFMSESSASRLFKREIGMNFVEYVNTVRLRYAVEDLLYSQKSITEISEDCGFSTPSSFNKLFKKMYNCSPTQYKERMRRAIPADKEESVYVGDRLQRWLDNQKKGRKQENQKERIVEVGDEIIFRYQYEGNNCINFCEASDLLQAAVQEQLREMKEQLGIQYVRLGGFFHNTMYLCSGERAKKFNFAHVDSVLDFLDREGLYPIVNLTGYRRRIYLDVEHILFNDFENFTDLERWGQMLEHLIRHMVYRYGEKSVEHWYFVMEDNVQHDFYASQNNKCGELPYPKLWMESCRVIKSICPEARFGGDISLLEEGKMIPDFLTLQLYPYSYSREDKEVYARRMTDFSFIKNGILRYKKQLRQLGYEDMEILVSAWNTSISDRNSYNDSCAKAAHVLMHLMETVGMGVTFCYNYGSDFLSQYFDTNAPLVGANGLMTKAGIPKPVYFSFYYLNRLYPEVLERDGRYMVTTDGKGDYCILACNPKAFGHNYYLQKENRITVDCLSEIFEEQEELTLKFMFRDMWDRQYRIQKQILGEEKGSILKEWEHMGYTQSLERGEADYLKHVCRPRIFCSEQKTNDGKLVLELKLKAHEIAMVHISHME